MKVARPLYTRIVQVMPVVCVDLVAMEPRGAVLMVRRVNPPAQGRWWFPGGRVWYRELRSDAAVRKLKEECGLRPRSVRELGTFDVILEECGGVGASHGVATAFLARVSGKAVRLDRQSSQSRWKTPARWLEELTDPYLRDVLAAVARPQGRR